MKNLEKFCEDLKKANMGYFKGKKVPYAKNMSYKQCIFNPYSISGSASFITVQVVGKLVDANLEARLAANQQIDNLTRKMQFHQKNTLQYKIQKTKTDSELFELNPQEANIHNFGKIVKSTDKQANHR